VLPDILTQGIKDGRFRPDLSVGLVRDIILGTLDWENLTCLASGEIEESVADFEDILSLVYAIIEPQKEVALEKPERILFAAENIFADRGFTKATVNEVAKLAGVAEGTVYEYYQNKEDLLLSIALKRFENYLRELPETFEMKSPIRKLRRFIKYYFLLFLMERDFLVVFLLQIQLNKRFYGSRAFDAFQRYYQVVEGIIEEGKKDGSFRAEINPRVFRNMFLGTFSHLALRWLIVKKDRQFDEIGELNSVVDLLSDAVIAKH
jgi:TetR/AcrR family fatty acid metabolism transcriptional regulator